MKFSPPATAPGTVRRPLTSCEASSKARVATNPSFKVMDEMVTAHAQAQRRNHGFA